LQETVIFTAVKRAARARSVLLTHSAGPPPLGSAHLEAPREVPYEAVLRPGDPERILHIPREDVSWIGAPAAGASDLDAKLPCTLAELGVSVSTGRVVDFRVRPALRGRPGKGTVPLLYPVHLQQGRVQWPLAVFRKPQHLSIRGDTEALLLPLGPTDRYVLVKRFSSKEQRRRIVAAQCEPRDLAGASRIGVENHLNVLSGVHGALNPTLARGLCGFLNSTLLDNAFRQFSGHTQVNASDLRRLRFPDHACLVRLGHTLDDTALAEGGQGVLDALVMAALAL
jgi:adenine-specific DNA-methyltransferase